MDWSFPLWAACERNPRRVALRYRGEALTFAELESRVAGLARGLSTLGEAAQTVAWMLPNVPEAIVLSMALARAGLVSVPLNGRLTVEELAFILDDCGAQVLVLERGRLADALALGRRVECLETILLVEDGSATPVPAGLALLHELREPGGQDASSAEEVSDERLATLLYTSGTTGFPKGVMRTHRANAWNVVNSALGSPRTPQDVELFNLPAFGIGLLHFAIPALLGGASVVLDHTFSAERVWRLLAQERVTRAFLAPTMLSAMLSVEGTEELDLSALRTIYSAYEFPEPLRERALERFGDVFIYMYGLTEAQLTCTRPGEFTGKPGSVGGAMGAMRVRVCDPSGRRLDVGTVGEIELQGPSTMSGYHDRPEESAAAMHDGWVRTGDLGRIDEDGDLHYVARAKEMIKTGGFSVDPSEVERALLALDGVAEAAVIGVPHDHWGEMVLAFVVPTPGAAAPAEAALIEAARARIAGYKVPKRIHLLDALPVNATGKVQRARLRELAAATLA
jgi:acyl-CoA synthetase (AMP-forming)/AMP-acid ligase II